MLKLIYFILPIFLIAFCDLLGTIVINKYNLIKLKYNTGFGFILLLGLYYVIVFIPICLSVSFRLLLIITLTYLLLLVIFICANCNKYYHFPKMDKTFCLTILLIVIQYYFLTFNSIGLLMRFDTVTYGNLISGTIYGENINYLDYSNGYYYGINPGYSFQSFYKLASVLYYLMNGLCNKIGIEFFYFTQHTWMYSTVLYVIYAQFIINMIKYFNIKKPIQLTFIICFFVLFIGNFYWNSEQAYLGNSFRMLFCSYSLLYLHEFFINNNYSYLIIICFINYALCSCACSNTTLVLIFMFFVFVYACSSAKEHYLVIFSCLIPLLNMSYYVYDFSLQTSAIVFATIVMAILLVPILNIKIIDKAKIKHILPICVLFTLVLLSYSITHNLFDFSSFTNNLSGWGDMSWDYFDFSSMYHIVANVLFLFMFSFLFVTQFKNRIVKFLLYIILFFFNPFASAIQNHYMIVFYRNYDIVINYFSIFLAISALNESYAFKKYNSVLYATLSILSLYIGIEEFLYHPDEGFVINDKYDKILRMDSDEAGALSFLKYYYSNNNIQNVKVISSIYQIRCEMPFIKTLFSRNKQFNQIYNETDLYYMFYPPEYYGDPYKKHDINWDQMDHLIKNACYNYIVYNKNIVAYINDNEYVTVSDLLFNCGYEIIYENDTYIIYKTGY